MTAAVPITQASKRTILGIIQTVTKRLALNVPTLVIGNADQQVIQLLELAQQEGEEFSLLSNKNGGWQELRKEYTFSTAGVGGSPAITGNTISGSKIVTNITTTTGIIAGWVATGSGIVFQSLVSTVDSGTQVTLDTAATKTATGVSLTFGAQSYSLPADFNYFINQTFWDRSYRWQNLGPLDAQEWQVLKSGISPTGPRRRFRIMGNLFYIDPVPSSITSQVYEYQSNGWCQSSAGVAQTIWTADTDYYSLADDCLIYGIIWRYLAAKRLGYDEEYNTYVRACERQLSRNGASRSLPLNATAGGVNLLSNANIPDTNFGS